MFTGYQDSKQWLRKLTLKRIINAFLVVTSFYLSRILRRPIIWGKPLSLSVEPTTSCNLRCPECPSGLRSFSRPTGMMDESLFQRTIDQLSDTLAYLLLYFQGEPYLHPHFLDLVSYASKKGIYTATSTNAHYLSDENARQSVESGLDRLIISIDGTSQDTYEQYRVGGDLQKVIDGTKRVVAWKNQLNSHTPHLVFQFLVVKPNEHQVTEVKQLAAKLGVNQVVFKTAQLYDFENGNPLMPESIKFSRYKKQKGGTYSIKNKLMNHCWKMWHSTVITWDGTVVPCCFDKDAKHQLGSLKDQPFEEIWHSNQYNGFRGSLLKNRQGIDICKNCTEGTKVWA